MSQESCTSTIPSEFLEDQDIHFITELNEVDELYFCTNLHVECENSDDLSNEDNINYESDSEESEGCLTVALELCDEDNKEYIIQSKFSNDTCGCKDFYNGQPCSSIFDFNDIVDYRESCKELSREELDLIIKSQLFAHRRSGYSTQSKKHKVKERERPYQEYYFNGSRVCRQTFCFLHGVEKKKILAIAKSLDNDGLRPRVHGRVGKSPVHGLTYDDRERIKTFLCKYARDNALPLPGRLPNFKDSRVLLLPSDKTSEDIFKMYQTLSEKTGCRQVSLRTFQRLWKDLCPHIVINKPCTDLCQQCQEFALKLANSGSLAEEEKTILLTSYNAHVILAKDERDHYRKQCRSSKENYSALPDSNKSNENLPQSVDTAMHYSWDYAQQVHFPHHSQQVGPVYFRTPRKCNVFGMCSEGSGKQVFYLVDESENPGKGANSVVSMVHHYLEHFGHGETEAQFNFDNCSGQNKNNVVLWYAIWRVLTVLHRKIDYSMMIAGHTKFEPDWHFGIWKMKWRNSNAETIKQVADTVLQSSKNRHNIPQLVDDDEKPVVFRDWKTLLKAFFRPLKYISKYHHFCVSVDEPGVVTCKESISSDEVKVNLLRNKHTLPLAGILPEPIERKELDIARQWYLFEQIREFCSTSLAKDIVCPKPSEPKPQTVSKMSGNISGLSKGGKRKQLLLQ